MTRTKMTVVAGLATLLGTLALWPLLETRRWPYLAFLVVVVHGATGWLCRRARVPAPLALLAHLIVLLVLLTALFAQQSAALAVIPTPASLGTLRDLCVSGFIDIRRFTAPAPETEGLVLLAVGGTGLVAAAVDFIAVQLRHAAAAGLPLLTLYSVSAGVLTGGPGWTTFVLGAVGYLALLLVDSSDRIVRWGHPVIVQQTSRRRRNVSAPRQIADTAPLASLGRRIGAISVAMAVGVPMLVPLTDAGAGGPGNGMRDSWLGRFGAPTLHTPDPVVSMRRDLLRQSGRVLFTYTTDDRQPSYLRTVSLTEFDGETWRADELRGYDDLAIDKDSPLPTQPGNPTVTVNVRTKVDVRDNVTLSFLPAPYAPREVDASGNWYYDPGTLTVFAPRQSPRGISYSVVSDVPHPSPLELEAAPSPATRLKPYLELPDNLPNVVRENARHATRGKPTRYEKALELQRWFTSWGGFTYSTEPAGSGSNALASFLRTRRGYCEQYASAMAIMARVLGIPARVAVGYTQGEEVDGQWQVRGRDAHAWPELWFQGVGWVRFEPTPAGTGGQASAAIPDYSRANALQPDRSETDDPSTAGGAPTDGPSAAAPSVGQRPEPTSDSAPGARPAGLSTPVRLGLLGLGVALLAVLLLPPLLRHAIRRRRWATARDPAAVAHVAWREMVDDAVLLGVSVRANESPRATGERLRRTLDDDEAAGVAVRRIALAEEHARYAATPSTPSGLRADVQVVRTALTRRAARRRRALRFVRRGAGRRRSPKR